MQTHRFVNCAMLCLTLISGTCFAGKVVFLHGTACSGKTGLCKELAKYDEWRVVSEDDIFYARAALRWEKEFPEEFKIIKASIDKENILHAVMRNQILFRAQVSDAVRMQVKKAIGIIQEKLNSVPKEKREDPDSWSNMLRRQITQMIIELAQTHHVIVDTWFLRDVHIAQIAQQCDVMRIVLYCPFLDLIKRTMKRNYEALMSGTDLSSFRFFHQTLNSFTGAYTLSDSENDSIDTLEKETVVHGCDIVSLQLGESDHATGSARAFTRGEFSPQAFEEYRQNFLAQFKAGTVFVCPKIKADLVIRTDQKSSVEAAAIVQAFVTSK